MKHLDKAHHFMYSLGLAVLASFFVGVVWGVAFAAVLGFAKELWDGMPPRYRFDWWDLVANIAGLAAAWMVIT